MRAVIDTSSLLALVRYYLPFEKDDSLKKFIKGKIDGGELIILDKVILESKRIAQGIILEEINYLKDKSIPIKTETILPESSFIRDLENRLCYGSQKNKLSEPEFEKSKLEFLESPDAKLIIYCLMDKGSLAIDKTILVSEETRSDNDNKLFKKLPEICTILGIEHCNLPVLLKDHFKIYLSNYLE